MIVFDTSAVIDFLHGGEGSRALAEKTERAGESIAVTAVSWFELLAPFHHRHLDREEREVRSFLSRCEILPLDADSAEAAAGIMGHLLRLGKPINAFDVLIAGIAVNRRADGLATRDRDFEEVSKVSRLQG